MAEVRPLWVATPSTSYAAKVLRYGDTANLHRLGGAGASDGIKVRSGCLGTGSLLVRQTTSPSMTVNVNSGHCVIQGSGATQGAYICTNDADDTVVLDAPHATLARKDIVIGRVYDADDGVTGSGYQFLLDKVTGTPSGSPAVPSTPTDALLLAVVAVAAGGATVISNANITDSRVFTAGQGGLIPCLSTALPANPWAGLQVWLTDIPALDIYDGAAWQRLYRPRVWTNLTLTSAWTNLGGGFASLGYNLETQAVVIRGVIRATVSAPTTNSIVTTLPAGARPAQQLRLGITGGVGPDPDPKALDVLTNGEIHLVRSDLINAYMFFDGCRFPLG